MALKDWKKVKKYMETQGITTYTNNKINEEIIIHSPQSAFTSTGNFVVRIDKQRFRGNIDRQEFSSKSQALAFAKQYMRTH